MRNIDELRIDIFIDAYLLKELLVQVSELSRGSLSVLLASNNTTSDG